MASGIKLVLGLGNPGPEYAKTRHNAGFWFLDALSEKLGARLLSESKLHANVAKADFNGQRVLIAKPTTFMNRSGLASQALLSFYKIEAQDMLVVHDELDLNAGVARLKFEGGHGGQNGLRDWVSAVPALEKNYRVVMLDLPGFANSGQPSAKLDPIIDWTCG